MSNTVYKAEHAQHCLKKVVTCPLLFILEKKTFYFSYFALVISTFI